MGGQNAVPTSSKRKDLLDEQSSPQVGVVPSISKNVTTSVRDPNSLALTGANTGDVVKPYATDLGGKMIHPPEYKAPLSGASNGTTVSGKITLDDGRQVDAGQYQEWIKKTGSSLGALPPGGLDPYSWYQSGSAGIPSSTGAPGSVGAPGSAGTPGSYSWSGTGKSSLNPTITATQPATRLINNPNSFGSIDSATIQRSASNAALEALQNGWMTKTPQIRDPQRQVAGVGVGNSFGFQDGNATFALPNEGQSISGKFGEYRPLSVNTPTVRDFGSSDLSESPAQIVNGLLASAQNVPVGSPRDIASPVVGEKIDVLNGWTPTMASVGGSSAIQDMSGRIDQVGAPLKDREAFYQQFMTGLEGGKASDYSNGLEAAAEGKILQNMNRELPAGYDESYLKDLSASGIDPLKDAFDYAMRNATADFNRRGLAASGFEDEAKYGTQDDSITTSFLKQAGNVARDVSLRGAEAKREDLYRNAGLQDQAVDSAASLSNAQNSNNLTRWSSDLSRQMQEKDLLARGLGLSTDAELANKDLASQAINLLSQNQGARDSSNLAWDSNIQNAVRGNNADNLSFAGAGLDQARVNADNAYRYDSLGVDTARANEANRLDWLRNNQDASNTAWNRTSDAAKLSSGLISQDNAAAMDRSRLAASLADQDESNRLDWARFGADAIIQDNATDLRDYQAMDAFTKYLTNRYDTEQLRQEAKDISLQTDNIGQQQQVFNNLMALVAGQQPSINAANQSAQFAAQQKAQADAAHVASKQNTGLNGALNFISGVASKFVKPS